MEALQAMFPSLPSEGTPLTVCVLHMNSNQVVNLPYSALQFWLPLENRQKPTGLGEFGLLALEKNPGIIWFVPGLQNEVFSW